MAEEIKKINCPHGGGSEGYFIGDWGLFLCQTCDQLLTSQMVAGFISQSIRIGLEEGVRKAGINLRKV